jgi:hypothetical protein
VGVVVVIARSAVLRDLGAGDGTDRATDESTGFITDEGTGAGAKGTADEGTAFTRRAGNERRGGHESEETKDQGVFHGVWNEREVASRVRDSLIA